MKANRVEQVARELWGDMTCDESECSRSFSPCRHEMRRTVDILRRFGAEILEEANRGLRVELEAIKRRWDAATYKTDCDGCRGEHEALSAAIGELERRAQEMRKEAESGPQQGS